MVEERLFLKTTTFNWTMKQLDLTAAIESCWIDMMLYMSQKRHVGYVEKKLPNVSKEHREDMHIIRSHGADWFECMFSEGMVCVRRMSVWELEEEEK